MSYTLHLDEYEEVALRRELRRRSTARKQGLCDYCHRKPSTVPCKFPDRHAHPSIVKLLA